MRVLFTVYPNSLAHLYPVVPLAWALQSAGHEVRIAAHASSADMILRTGLTPVSLGSASQAPVRLTDDCSPPHHQDLVTRYADVMGLTPEGKEHWIVFYQYLMQPTSDYVRLDRPEAKDLIDFAVAWQPDLIFWDATIPAAAVAAKVSGAAHARLLIGHDMYGWSLDRLAENEDQLRAAGLDPNPLATLIRPLAEQYGFEVDDELLVGQWSVETMLEGMRLPTSTKKLAMRHVPYVDPQVFPNWLYERPELKRCECCGRKGRRRVALSLGESTRRFINGDWDRTPKILKAVEQLEDLEIVATLDKAQLSDVQHIPDNVRTIEWVSLPHLAPTCSALIHHGGIGTYSSAVAYKVPQLVCDLEGVSLMMRLVEPGEADVHKSGTYRVGWEFDEREEGNPDAATAHWELPAKKVEATVVSDFVLSTGAGVRLDHRAKTVDEIRDLIWSVATDQRYHHAAAALQDDWLAMPSPSDVIPDLEKLIVQHRRR